MAALTNVLEAPKENIIHKPNHGADEATTGCLTELQRTHLLLMIEKESLKATRTQLTKLVEAEVDDDKRATELYQLAQHLKEQITSLEKAVERFSNDNEEDVETMIYGHVEEMEAPQHKYVRDFLI